jgi:hypothetical protein
MDNYATNEERAALRAEALTLLKEHDALRAQLTALKHKLDKACADYGRATNRWGFTPDHLRIEIYHMGEMQ